MIWCVDDDKTICDIEVYALKQTGFEAKGFSDGISMLEQLKVEKPDLIILDVMLPEKDGLEVLKELKSSSETSKIPVIMATAKGTEMDKVSGLDFDSVLNVGKISLITKEHVVKVDGEKVSLTLKEYELLKLFMENVGIVFSRNQLLSLIWSTDYVGESRTVDMHIKNLRQKLSQCGKYIQTVIGVGYKMERIDD